MKDLRLVAGAGMCLVLVSTLMTACTRPKPAPSPTGRSSGTFASLVGKSPLRIGVKIDQPGIGEIVDNDPNDRRGFDIDVARYLARELRAGPIEWHDVTPRDREHYIETGRVDLVIASYTITDERLDRISFAGPYLVVGQDILIRASDAGSITDRDSLRDKKICGVTKSISAKRLVDYFSRPGDDWNDHVMWFGGYQQCVDALLAEKVDAVSTDNAILAGYAARNPSRLRLVNKPFTTEEYGIGLAKDDTANVARINAILRKMIEDGSWADSLRAHLGESADEFIAAVPAPLP